jgi:hypothetical protein
VSEAKDKEKDPRLPLSLVCFREPTSIPGSTSMMTTLEAGIRRVVNGKDWLPPPMWLNMTYRVVQIGDRNYPMERVHYYERAKAAITKAPPPLDLTKYTIGKKAAK